MIDDDHSKESTSLERVKNEMKEQLFREIFQKIKQEQALQVPPSQNNVANLPSNRGVRRS
jgi:hypothetical protein